MRITGLKPQRRSKKRLSVFVDGEFAFSLDKETVAEFGLKEGERVDRQFLEQVVLEEQYRLCRNYAFLLLSYKARTEKELKERLEKKGYSPVVIARVLERLKELGLADDEKLTKDYVEERIRIGHKGKWRVKQELLKRGVAKEKVEQALRDAPDETEAAMMVLEHFLPRYQRLDEETKLRRIYGLLARRGFSPETIKNVLLKFGLRD
ncbi:MAG: RecX family transcriptional regulator [candidate division WOR-3 bacterium]